MSVDVFYDTVRNKKVLCVVASDILFLVGFGSVEEQRREAKANDPSVALLVNPSRTFLNEI